MRIGQLISGIASGYLTRGIQFLSAIAIVPFFLQDRVLGLDGYGRAFTILALSGLLRFFVDGIRLSFSRDVSRALGPDFDESPGTTLGNRLKAMVLICTGLVVITAPASPVLVQLVGIDPSRDAILGLCLAIVLFWSENAFHLLRVPLVVRGSISFVNVCVAGEVVLRTATYFVVFSVSEASLFAFFAIRVGFVMARNLVFGAVLYATSARDLHGFWRARWRPPWGSMRYSVPITADRVTNEMVQRLPILAASATLGADASGLVALVLNTTRRYLVQMLFSVLQPIAVPIASRLDPRRISASALTTLWNVEAFYTLGTALVACCAITAMPELITFWLGPEYQRIVVPVQILLAASAFEISYRVRQSLLLGQGLLAHAVPTIVGAGLLTALGVVGAAFHWQSWRLMIGFAAAFYVAWSLAGIGRAFWRQLGSTVSPAPSRYRGPLFLSMATAASFGLSQWRPFEGGLVGAIPPTAAGFLATLLLGHLCLVRIPDTLQTLVKLRRSLHRDIFSQERPLRSGSP